MSGTKGVRGCVIASDPSTIGFVKYPYLTRSMEECLEKARNSKILCSHDGKRNCSYFIFANKTFDDMLREGNIQYKNGNIDKALKIFYEAWLSLDPIERENELAIAKQNPGRFLDGFGGWIAKNNKHLKKFINVKSDNVKKLNSKGKCWVANSDVLNDKDTGKPNNQIILSDEVTSSTQNKCKYNLFEVPPNNVSGETISKQMVNMYKRRVAQKKKEMERIKNQLKKDKIALQISEKHTEPWNMIAEAVQVEKDLKRQEKIEPYRRKLLQVNNSITDAVEKTKIVKNFDKLADKAVKSTGKLVKQEKRKIHKLSSDINNINWSLNKNNQQEILQNKIMSSLSIIIIIIVALIVFVGIYYMYKGSPVNSKKITATNTQAGTLNSIFSKPKAKVAGTTSNKSVIDNIFKF
jgi:tetratricopeptide (TPR) repeat protein